MKVTTKYDLIKINFVNRNKKIDRDLVTIARSSSESLLGGIDVQDPEENDLSDDEAQPIAATA